MTAAPGGPSGAPEDLGPVSENAAWYARRWLQFTVQANAPLLERLWLTPGDRVLDVACGPGALVMEASTQAGPLGVVVGLDLSAGMLSAGKRLARRRDVRNVRWVRGSLDALPFAGESFDAATCAYGPGLAGDMVCALRELLRVLRPGGRVCVANIADAAHSPGAALLQHLLGRRGVGDGGPALGPDPEETIRSRLEQAGFQRCGAELLHGVLRRADFKDYWDDVLAGYLPGVPLYRSLPAQEQAAVRAEARGEAERYAVAGGLALPIETVLGWGVA